MLKLFVIFFLLNQLGNSVPLEGSKIMITTPAPLAAKWGEKIYRQGGNVADVAVAVGLMLSVTSPYYASLGAGGLGLIKMNGKNVEALDFRETAPHKTHEKFYLDKPKFSSDVGPLAVGIPGFPAGLWAIHKKYGKLKWSQLFSEPILIAEKGFPVSGEWVDNTEKALDKFNISGIKYFTNNKTPLNPGENLKQPQLAKALKLFRDLGLNAIYDGEIAKDIVETTKKLGGIIESTDLKNYKVRWLEPIVTNLDGYQIYLMPPPSSGGVVIKSALTLIDQLGLKNMKPLSSNELHYLAEIMKISFQARALLGDPDFNKNPVDQITNSERLKKLAEKISLNKSIKLDPLPEDIFKSKMETTQYNVMDIKGNAISITVTLNDNYGSNVVTDKFGIALNDEMDDFTTKPNEPNMYGLIQGKANYVQPGKRPLSSMSPTIVTQGNKTVLSLSASGGPRIITAVLQSMYRALINKFDMEKAINAPRVHHQFLPDILYYNKQEIQPDVFDKLSKLHKMEDREWMGRANGVKLNEKNILEGAFDSRGEGASAGF